MVRGLSLVSVLVALLVGGWLLTAQQSSPSRTTATQAIDEAQQAANGVAFQQAEAQLEQFRSLNGTYAGASLAGFGVTLARADAGSYCLQTATAHLAGPGGAAAAGPC
jgi:predicted negative regulator of RcsB-dependent stress response